MKHAIDIPNIVAGTARQFKSLYVMWRDQGAKAALKEYWLLLPMVVFWPFTLALFWLLGYMLRDYRQFSDNRHSP